MGTTDERLDAVERSLQRVEALLSMQASAASIATNGGGNGSSGGSPLFAQAAASATAQLSAAAGEENVRAQLTEALVRIGDPETLGALTRVVDILPQLEYAVHALAAGPELLDEFTHGLDEWAEEQGLSSDGKRRLALAQDVLRVVAQPQTIESFGRLGQVVPQLTPVVEGAGDAIAQLAAVEGADSLRERIAETILQIAEPEALSSLTTIVALAPKLEYAVHALAAGPELLEEALELIHEKAGTGPDLQRRVEDAAATLVALSTKDVQAALREMVGVLPTLSPVLGAAGSGFAQVQAVHGESVAQSLEEVVLRLAEPETLESLGNTLVLLPKLEYLLHFGAAGPELLEEAMDMVRERTEGVPLNELTQAGTELVAALLQPELLRTVTRLTRGLAESDGAKLLGSLDAERLGSIAGKIDLAEIEQLLEVTSLPKLAHLLEVMDLEAVAELAKYAGPLSRIAQDTPWSHLEGYLELLNKPDVLDGLRELLELAPSLAKPLRALPVQARTLRLLSTVNDAVEEACAEPVRRGPFGAPFALRDPNVQAFIGMGLEVARRAGNALRKSPKELTAGS